MTAQTITSLCGVVLSLFWAPLLPGVINWVKALMGGRKGQAVTQLYSDLRKLMRKSPVYPVASTWCFRVAPAAGLAATAGALVVLPFGAVDAVVRFPGDFVLLAGFFALSRFTLILAALDTGSVFEGMGAAREALFSALAEPVFLFCLLILGRLSQSASLSAMMAEGGLFAGNGDGLLYFLLGCSLFLLLLCENSRIPVDDPSTHLELTMIHEVMILDHSGPDLAFLEYASALKLWVFSLLVTGILTPVFGEPLFTPAGDLGAYGLAGIAANWGTALLGVLAVGVFVGLVESCMARLRMERVSQVLTLAGSFAVLAALWLWRQL